MVDTVDNVRLATTYNLIIGFVCDADCVSCVALAHSCVAVSRKQRQRRSAVNTESVVK